MLNKLTATVCLVLSSWGHASDHLIELDHELNERSLFWPSPNAHPFSLESIHAETSKDLWYSSNKFCSPEHIGTHLDAPIHFSHTGWSLEKIPLEHLVRVPGVVIDIRDKVKQNSVYELSPADVVQSVDTYGPFPNNSVVIVLTGWSERYNNKKSYFGHESDATKFVFPGVNPKAVQTLLGYKESINIHIVGIGIDTGSLDFGPSKSFTSHRVLAASNGYIIENMKNLEKLPPRRFKITVMPIKITSGTGGPARVFAEVGRAEANGTSKSGLSVFLFLSGLITYVFRNVML